MLFIPFQELKDRIGILQSQNESIGLGLACSSDICKKVGGDITLKKSEEGITVIAFKFPVTLKSKVSHKNSYNDIDQILKEKSLGKADVNSLSNN